MGEDIGTVVLIMLFAAPVVSLALVSYIESVPEQLAEWRLERRADRAIEPRKENTKRN